MNQTDILDKIANIYTLRSHSNGYNKFFIFVILFFLIGYFHFMFRRLSSDNQLIIKQNNNLYSLILKKCIADNKYMSKPLLWI
jgi:hypothetical protein